MSKNDPLIDCISAMSQAEKRYFRRFARFQSEEKECDYLRLFEFMDKAKQYNEEKVKLKMGVPYFAQLKYQLYAKILESQRHFYADQNPLYQAVAPLIDAQVLLQKSLFSQADKALQRAGKKMDEYGKYFLHPELVRTRNVLSRTEEHPEESLKVLEAIDKEAGNAYLRLKNELQFEKDYARMVNWNIRIELVREQKELDELQHIIHQSHFKAESNALTREAKINFHFIKGLYYYLSGNFKLSLKHFERESELIEAHDAFRSSYLSSYFRSISNTCFAAIKSKNEQLAQQKIAQLSIFGKGVPGPYRVLVVHLLQLKLYCETRQYQEAMVYLKRFEQEIIALVSREEFAEKYYIERTHVLFKAAEIYMMNGETKKPLQMMNIFLDSKNTTVKSDFYCMARIINLLIHFDIDNIDLLEYEIKSIHRFLSGRKRVFLFERSVLKLVQQLIHPDKHKQRQTYFKAWHKELLKLEQTEFEKNVFDFFDFTYWVERKIVSP